MMFYNQNMDLNVDNQRQTIFSADINKGQVKF